ncbi:hypothetical protein ES703_24126 [subsurface metagenome]
MFKDKAIVWVLEYIFGGTLVIMPLMGLIFWRPAWIDAKLWAAQLFVVCLGVILVSCASSMRQRMLLAKSIDNLAKQIADGSAYPQK